ncbi:MAG: hypothetical protein R2710_26135 [Acidimicrobiales bacterium]
MAFVIIGAVGAVLLVFSLIFDDVLEGVLPDGDLLSLPSIAAAMVAFGFGTAVLDRQVGLPVGLAVTGGSIAAVVAALGAVRASRAAIGMATDATPTSNDLLGATGRVITEIPTGSTGQVLVRLGGQPVKLTALTGPSGPTLSTGTDIVVVSVESSTKVTVQAAADFWSAN